MLNTVPNPNQFNISLRPELKRRLADLAVEFEIDGATKVGALIIKTYVEHWAKLQAKIREGKNQVEREIMGDLERPALVKGNPQSNHAKRKKRP